MPSSGLEDLDHVVVARRRSRKLGGDAVRRPPADGSGDGFRDRPELGGARSAEPVARRARAARGRVAAPGRIRTLGIVAGLVAPAVAGVLGVLLWAMAPSNGVSGAAPALIGYVLGLLAVPTLLATGLPFFGGAWRVALAVASSGLLWLTLGRWAAGRATRDIDAGWRDYIVEMTTMTIGVWAGVVVGLVAMVLILGR